MATPKPAERRSVFDSTRKPPPNYFSRRIQMKVMVLVFLFMAILMLMTEVRKPENWRWMWRLGGAELEVGEAKSQVPSEETADEPTGPLDTRAPSKPSPSRPAEPLIRGPATPIQPTELLNGTVAQSLHKIQIEAWSRVLDRLSQPERQLFLVGLWKTRQRLSLDDSQEQSWSALITKLDTLWTEFHTMASTAVMDSRESITESQIQHCDEVLRGSQSAWRANSQVLAAVPEPTPLSSDDRQTLARLQKRLDERAFAQIEDNTTLRSAENEAWFRMWEMLRGRSDDQLANTEQRSFVQLFSQPNEYRGQCVAVRGTARLGYAVTAQQNEFGIERYYVLWIRPQGVDSPIAVYGLELPEGFPAIQERRGTGEGTPLSHDVIVSGYFFKRWLYRSKEGLNLAPLMLGQITHWERPLGAASEDVKQWISGPFLSALILLAAVIATVIAVSVYRASRWTSRQLADITQAPESLPPFDERQVGPSVEESLRQLADDDPSMQ